jgi:hypothetical protein
MRSIASNRSSTRYRDVREINGEQMGVSPGTIGGDAFVSLPWNNEYMLTR